jgi:hypothetical protein
MSAMPAQNSGSLQAIRRWFRTQPDTGACDLAAVGDREVEQTAKDLGVSPTELYSLARSNVQAADLLTSRWRRSISIARKWHSWCRRHCTICSAFAPYATGRSNVHAISRTLPWTSAGRIIAQTSQPCRHWMRCRGPRAANGSGCESAKALCRGGGKLCKTANLVAEFLPVFRASYPASITSLNLHAATVSNGSAADCRQAMLASLGRRSSSAATGNRGDGQGH